MKNFLVGAALLAWALVLPLYAQLASKCSSILPNGTTVACVNNYAAVMPVPFSRTLANTTAEVQYDSFRLTNVSDPSFELVKNATFIVFNQTAGLQILGSNPSYEFVMNSTQTIHEAPVYVPWLNSIIYSNANMGELEQRLLNLSTSPPTLQNYTTNPPVYVVNGGRLFNGSIYWAVEGSGPFPNPQNTSQILQQAPGIARLNPNTSTVEFLLNNYFGTPFNSPDDLVVDSNGDIFFTDPWFGYIMNTTQYYPPSNPATFRFRPSTGQTSIVDNMVDQPNGIGISPDGRTLYLTATASVRLVNDTDIVPRDVWNRRGDHSVYAFDMVDSPGGKYLVNRRAIYRAEEFIEDGFHVSAEGYLIGASGYGVDVLSPYGELLVRITVPNVLVNNIQFVNSPSGGSRLYILGEGGIGRVDWNLRGMVNE